MIQLKNTFQKVLLITAVWVSFTHAPIDPAGLNACRDAMQIFGLKTPPLEFIKTAIKEFKLLNGGITFTADTEAYYKSFKYKVFTDKFVQPVEYCERYKGVPTEQINEEFKESWKCLEDLAAFYHNIDYNENVDDKSTESLVLNNALYHHKQATSTMLPYFHSSDSYGFSYLNDIADGIKLKDSSLGTPADFCNSKYNTEGSSTMVELSS